MTIRKVIRIALTFWFAVPLMALGWLLSFLWKPCYLLAFVGLWAMGFADDLVVG
jgi:hypothetical protein